MRFWNADHLLPFIPYKHIVRAMTNRDLARGNCELMPLRICLIRPGSPELLDDRIDPPIGLLYLASSLEKAGHEVVILDFAGCESPPIPEADLYGITLFTTSMPGALQIRDHIRSFSDAPIMVGGPHALALPQSTLKDFDYVVIGEAEETLLLVLEDMVQRRLSNPIVVARAPSDLGALPYNNYKLVKVELYSRSVAGERVLLNSFRSWLPFPLCILLHSRIDRESASSSDRSPDG